METAMAYSAIDRGARPGSVDRGRNKLAFFDGGNFLSIASRELFINRNTFHTYLSFIDRGSHNYIEIIDNKSVVAVLVKWREGFDVTEAVTVKLPSRKSFFQGIFEKVAQGSVFRLLNTEGGAPACIMLKNVPEREPSSP